MKRRGFLQQAGSMLAALGLSESGLWLLSDRTRTVLAQPARRKLALLIGIDQYPITHGTVPLTGCVTDVQLQRELLIHRFGFPPEDILTLTNEQATRSQIETVFLSHLRDQATAEDLVVFHFSGYGRQMQSSDKVDVWHNTLVPVDGGISTQEPGTLNDLPLDTLWLMLRSLRTNQVLTVLDTSYVYSDRSLLGHFHRRVCPHSPVSALESSAQAFQKQLQQNSGSLNRFAKGNQVPGLILNAASPPGEALEAQGQGFSAGVLTYTLTQQLWQSTDPSIQVAWQQAVCQVKQWVGNAQHPQSCLGIVPPCGFETHTEADIKSPLLNPVTVGADGIVLEIDSIDRTARLWLAGLPLEILESYGVSSLLTVAPPESTPLPSSTQLQVRTREGLTVKAQILPSFESVPLEAGQLVWEFVRVIPRLPNLTIALDSSLERIERVDATSAFANLRYVSPVILGEQPADCLFGRVPSSPSSTEAIATGGLPSGRGSYGLLSSTGEIIPGSITPTEEAVKTAIGRLSPQLDQFRAAKLLRSIVNEGSSQLGISATLGVVASSEQVILQKQTSRGIKHRETPTILGSQALDVLTLPALSRIRYQVQNLNDHPIYFVMVSVEPDGRTSLYYPFSPDVELHHCPVLPGDMAIVPSSSGSEGWQSFSSWGGRSRGRVITHIVCSTRPFSATLTALEAARVPKSNQLEILSHPLDVAYAIVEDLHQASLGASQNLGLSKEVFALDVKNWATLSFIYWIDR